MIQIYDINDNLIYDAPLTEGCERVQELMAADHIQLSFKAVHSFTIPAGAYIDWFGIYRLLEPYTPTQQSEAEYLYTPQFHAEHITWKKYPFFFYTDEKAEPDWSLTGNATLFLDCVTMALQKTFGKSWHYSVASDLPASAYVAFQNTDIFSGLNAIAEAFKTEWYADLTKNRIYLGHVSRDEQAVLEVGKNVNVPSVAANSDAYFNRFYAFGSTRNIPQNYVGANTQNVVNKRLTLDPAKYPDGYKDIKDLKSGEEFATNLFFDNIYPRATEGTEGSKGLAISNVRERRLFKVERGTTNKIPTGETDENGNPIYEMYSIWYFNIASLEFSKSMIIEGTDLTCSFESGALLGREFVLGYHEEDQKLETADGTPFYVYAGDYEILYVEENGITIPTTGVGLIPADGDEVALFNLELPDSYVEIAYKELEAALDEEIARRQKDYNSYTFKSNPVAFAENDPNLYLGRAVKFINSGNALDTRITKLTYKLDSESPLFPNEMTITIGEKRIKGSIATLKEEVVNANRNIDLLAALNKQTTTIQEAYKRTQDAILQGFNRIANMWQFDDDGNVYSEFNVYTLKALSSKGISANEGGTGGTGIDIARMWEELASDDATKQINLSHMPSSVKTAVNWVSSVTSSDADSQINKWNEIVSFLSGISDTSSLSSILSGKANASAVEELSDDVSALSTHITNILGRKVNAGTGLTGGGTLNADVTLSLATIGKSGTYTKVIVDAYGRVTGSSTLLESDIPYLSIAKISNLQSTIDTINGKFLNYLPLSGGKMANANLVTNLNADLLDGVHLADVYRKSGWYRVVPYINNGGIAYHYWFKVAQINYTTTSGLAELELAAVSDANFMYSASARLTIKGHSGNPSCSVLLTSNAYLSTRINVALDKDGGVWVKSNCSWNSYLRWRAIVNDEGYTGITILDGSTKQLDQPINSCVIEENTGATYRQSKDAFETAWAAFDVGIGSFKSYSAQIKILPYNDSAYIEFGNADFTNNVPAFITGYSSNPLNLLTISSHSTIFTGSVTIGGANGVTLSFDATNDMLKFSKGGYFLGAVSTKGVSNDTSGGTGGAGVNLSSVWDSLSNNTDVYGSTKIHIDHIPTLTTSKISDFPTLVSAFTNDAGYITTSAIVNKADKATTLAGYGITDAVTLNTNQTITGLKTFKNAEYYTAIINSTLEDGEVRLILQNNNIPKVLIGYDSLGSFFYDYGSAQTLRIQNDGHLIYTSFIDAQNDISTTGWFVNKQLNKGLYNEAGQQRWYYKSDENQKGWYSTTDIIAANQLVSVLGTGTAPLKVYSTTMVSNLNANYLGGLNKDNFQKAIYDYINTSGVANTTDLPTILAPSNYNGVNSLGGNLKFYDTKFFSSQANTSNRCQLAYGYDVDSIHFRRYNDGNWGDWKEIAFTDGNIANADKLDGYHETNFVRAVANTTNDVNTNLFESNRPYIWRLADASNANNPAPYGNILHVGVYGSDTLFELCGAYNSDTLKFRRGNYQTTSANYIGNNAWRTIAFIDSLVENARGLNVDNNRYVNELPFGYGKEQVNWRFKDNNTIELTGTGGSFSGVLHLTPWGDKTGGPDHQLAFGYNGGIFHRYGLTDWSDWRKLAFTEGTDNLKVTNASARFTANNGTTSLFYGFGNGSVNRGIWDNSINNWILGTDGANIFMLGANVGVNTTTPAYNFDVNGTTRTNYLRVGNDVTINGDANISSMIMTNGDTGVLSLYGNYIDVYAPMNVHTTLKVGEATISWDSVNGMLKVDKGAYFTGPVSSKGVSNDTSGMMATAQFGVEWNESWTIDSNEVTSLGNVSSASILASQGSTNGSSIYIVCDAFTGKKVSDIEIFTLGWDGEHPADARLVPYKIVGNGLSCKLYLTGTMTPILFKIKIY